MADDWFYLNGEEQVGPYPGEQLHEIIASGAITRETLIWTEGMPEWLPAQQIDNLFPVTEAQLQVATPQASPATAATVAANPYTASPTAVAGTVAGHAVAGSRGTYPAFSVKKANFKLHLIFYLIIPAVAFAILMVLALGVGATASANPNAELSDGAAAGMGVGLMLVMAVLYICPLVGGIIGMVHLYRAWYCLQPGVVRCTPGQAVGFLFIPFFNLYWIFIAYKGLADEWNRIVASYDDLAPAPRFEGGIFLGYPIASIVFFPVGLIFYFMAHNQICKGINFMAARSLSTASAGSTGVRLY